MNAGLLLGVGAVLTWLIVGAFLWIAKYKGWIDE